MQREEMKAIELPGPRRAKLGGVRRAESPQQEPPSPRCHGSLSPERAGLELVRAGKFKRSRSLRLPGLSLAALRACLRRRRGVGGERSGPAVPEHRHELLPGEGSALDTAHNRAAGPRWLPDGDGQTDRQTDTRGMGGMAAGKAPPSAALPAETATSALDRRGKEEERVNQAPSALELPVGAHCLGHDVAAQGWKKESPR